MTAAEGGSFIFGGHVGNNGDIFGYGPGYPLATLTLTTTPAVPEPMSLALIGVGAIGLGAIRRRRAV